MYLEKKEYKAFIATINLLQKVLPPKSSIEVRNGIIRARHCTKKFLVEINLKSIFPNSSFSLSLTHSTSRMLKGLLNTDNKIVVVPSHTGITIAESGTIVPIKKPDPDRLVRYQPRYEIENKLQIDYKKLIVTFIIEKESQRRIKVISNLERITRVIVQVIDSNIIMKILNPKDSGANFLGFSTKITPDYDIPTNEIFVINTEPIIYCPTPIRVSIYPSVRPGWCVYKINGLISKSPFIEITAYNFASANPKIRDYYDI